MSRAQKILEMALQNQLVFLDSPESNVECTTVRECSENTLINHDSEKENILENDQDIEKEPSEKYNEIEDIYKSEALKEFTVAEKSATEPLIETSQAEDPEYNLTEDQQSEEGNENSERDEPSKRKRVKRRHVKESNWKREHTKRRRELGNAYEGKKHVNGKWEYKIPKKQRVLKKRCSCKISTRNQNSAKKPNLKCYLLSEEDRQIVFENFWKLNWGEKKIYVQLNMRSTKTERHRDRKEEEKSRRVNSFSYYLRKNNEPIKVCKIMFLNSLGIGEWTARSWKILNKQEDLVDLHKTAEEDEDERMDAIRKNGSQTQIRSRRLDTQRINCLQLFFKSLPKMESHYCRSTSQKLYLEPEWKSKQDLYELYSKDWCHQRSVEPFSITYFDHYFNDMNLSLFTRKKDECDLCVAKNMKNVSEEEYTVHQGKKKEAREEKERDKNNNSNKVYTMDLQAVLLCPKSNVSSLYYKTKLAVHNFTIYDIKTHAGYCFVWSEIEGMVGANEFSSIICSFAETQLPHLKPEDELIFYSDGCTGQNRNAILSSALLNFSVYHKVHIVQKYLERGHTQMEADSIHSCVERQLKNKVINVPADYIDVVKKARKKPEPYQTKYLDHRFFRNFSSIQYVPSIRPGKKTGDPTVTDLRALRYNPDGTIQFKLRHTDAWQLLPIRGNKKVSLGVPFNDVTPVYEAKLKIKKEKFDHLQILKTTMPSDYHAFYDNLQHF